MVIVKFSYRILFLNGSNLNVRYGVKIGESVQLQETQGIAYGLARVIIGWSQALLLGCVLILGANRVFTGQLSGPALTTFVFYTNFVTDASFDVGDQVCV